MRPQPDPARSVCRYASPPESAELSSGRVDNSSAQAVSVNREYRPRRRYHFTQFANRRNLRAWLGAEHGTRTWQAVLAAQALPLSDCWQILEAMAPIDASLESFGIESARLNSDSYTARYLPANDLYWCNTGDAYSTTIAFWHGRFRVTTWGDIVERYERRPKEQTA